MITVELNGRKVEAGNEKEARKALAKMVRDEKKEMAQREEKRKLAKLRAESNAYRVLSRLHGVFPCVTVGAPDGTTTRETLPPAWRFYAPHNKWSVHLFQEQERTDYDNRPRKTIVKTEDGPVIVDHYGVEFVGAVCNGSGYTFVVFLRDGAYDVPATCYAIGVNEGEYVLAEIPGATPEMFRSSSAE